MAKMMSFMAAMLVYAATFGSPLDTWADEWSFALHMVQHMAEIMVMVPLMMLGWEDWMVRFAFRRRPLVWLTRPFVGLIVFSVVFNLLHWPFLYDWALRSESWHFVEHVLFFITAIFLWWPILSVLPESPALTPGWRMIYLMSAMNMMMPVSVYLAISQVPWYAYPYGHDPALAALGLNPVADQQWGGVIMIIAGWAALGTAFWTAFRAYREPDSRWDPARG